MNRTELILNIFAQHTHSRDRKLQVELAQLEYLLPRPTGKGVSLSRLDEGIGTRGPGETRLEMDRRTIRAQLSRIKKELRKLEQRRSLHPQKPDRSYKPVHLSIPFSQGEVVFQLRVRGQIELQRYGADRVHPYAWLPLADFGLYQEFVETNHHVSSCHHRKAERR